MEIVCQNQGLCRIPHSFLFTMSYPINIWSDVGEPSAVLWSTSVNLVVSQWCWFTVCACVCVSFLFSLFSLFFSLLFLSLLCHSLYSFFLFSLMLSLLSFSFLSLSNINNSQTWMKEWMCMWEAWQYRYRLIAKPLPNLDYVPVHVKKDSTGYVDCLDMQIVWLYGYFGYIDSLAIWIVWVHGLSGWIVWIYRYDYQHVHSLDISILSFYATGLP